MADKDLFLDTLREVARIAQVSGTAPEKDEIRRYFGGMDLSEEQEEMVYQYLKNVPGEEENANSREAASENIESEDVMPGKTASEDAMQDKNSDEKETTGDDSSLDRLSESAYYRMYLNEVREKGSCSDEKLHEWYRLLLAGEDVTGQIVDGWLMRVIRMAELYKECGVNMQDLIQEGNVALWVALGSIDGKMDPADVDRYLQDGVREAFEDYIREVAGVSDQTQAMLAKAALLHEAQEFLASENGQSPSLREISEYTHIEVEEIQNILALYEQADVN